MPKEVRSLTASLHDCYYLGVYRAGLGLGTDLGYMSREQFTSFWGPQADPYLVAVRGVKSLGDNVLHCRSDARVLALGILL